MRKIIFITFMAMVSFMASSQIKIRLTVDGNSMTAVLTDNEATRELKGMLEKEDITIRMSDYGGFEKVGALPQSLPTSNSQITTVPGDIMLYQGNNLVIFYGSNTWSYTPIGKINGVTSSKLKQFLGNGDITLTISLDTSGIEKVSADENYEKGIYDLSGNKIGKKTLFHGIYVINGKNILK